VQDLVGDPAGVAALQTRVVLDRDPGQQRHLFAAQPGDPPVAAVRREAGVLGGELGAPSGQELADLGADVVLAGHAREPTGAGGGRESLPVPLSTGTPWLRW